MAKIASNWSRFALFVGFAEEDFGATFKNAQGEWKIVGYLPGRLCPIEVKNTRTGKKTALGINYVLRALNKSLPIWQGRR